MPELLTLVSADGPVISGNEQIDFRVPFNPGDTGAGAVIARATLARANFLTFSGSVMNGASSPAVITSAVTGSGSGQTININNGALIVNGDYWIVEPGSANQEVIQVGAPTGNTIPGTIMRNSHASGTVMLQVFSCYTRWWLPNFTFPGGGGPLNNIGFIRNAPLPGYVFDQCLILSAGASYVGNDAIPWIKGFANTPSITTVPLAVPQYDPTIVSVTGNPTNALVLAAGPITSAGVVAQIRIQTLFCVAPELPVLNDYSVCWDH